ncbi:MAG: NAD(P)-binding domain-containing protein [Marinoscillum sp.]|uniref:NAD(P)-binding domain-containing protein n=1 Tax=Marinoscillum sp. TaxID=2024838 RepID=UPI003304E27D
MMKNEHLPVAIIGGGPVGLATAAQLTYRNIPFVLFEAGSSVGQNLLSWGHVRVFSPWRYNMDKAAAVLLQEAGWVAPDKEGLPTGQELVDLYLNPLAALPQMATGIRLNSRVLSIGRKGLDKMKTKNREELPFSIKVAEAGTVRYVEARAVIDSSGTWNQPNPLGSGGVYAEGEEALSQHIFYGIPDVKGHSLDRYRNKHVVVVGSGHSAINTLLDLADLQQQYPHTRLTWVLRKENLSAVYGGQADDALEARGALGIHIEKLVRSGKLNIYTPYHILRLERGEDGKINVHGELKGEPSIIGGVDEMISNTGSRPDLEILREIRVDLDASLESVFDLAELIDPNVHSCGTVRPHGERALRHPEQDFYVVGSKSYGRAPTFLMATGYEQVRSVVAYLDGDQEAAERLELDLPETGVCSVGGGASGAGSACCGPAVAAVPAEEPVAACCH